MHYYIYIQTTFFTLPCHCYWLQICQEILAHGSAILFGETKESSARGRQSSSSSQNCAIPFLTQVICCCHDKKVLSLLLAQIQEIMERLRRAGRMKGKAALPVLCISGQFLTGLKRLYPCPWLRFKSKVRDQERRA